MQVLFEHCGQQQTVGIPCTEAGPLRCADCREVVTTVDVSDAKKWIESQVARKRELVRQGALGTRKQSTRQTDADIDRDGLSAELAASVLFSPQVFERWHKSAERNRGNRGRDLLRTWTGLSRPTEIKYTRYQDAGRGFLLIRPPRRTPGRMRAEYIDNAYYVLMTGPPFQHTAVGWTDRDGLLQDGELNPVPIRKGQRETWGMHWSKLRPIDQLIEQMGQGGRVSALRRWAADMLAR